MRDKEEIPMKIRSILLIISLCACLSLTGCKVESKYSNTVSIPTTDDEEYEKTDDSSFSFTEVEPKENTEPKGEEVKENVKKENGMKTEFSDVDGDGNVEYAMTYEVNDGDLITGAIELYFNNELIYEYQEELLMDPGKLAYEDLDADGEKEIFFSFYPRVNSMPLEEYVVLKKTGGTWNKLKTPVDSLGSNSFPIHIKYGSSPCELIISCDGYEETIVYDAEAHYEKMAEDTKNDENKQSFNEEFNRMLRGEGYEEGAEFGMVMPWGVWEIDTVTVDDKPMLKARQGIAGQLERYDQLGDLFIYFDFTDNGKLKIEKLEFFDYENYGVEE